jgi:protein with PEP-CTERM/exosortase system signal
LAAGFIRAGEPTFTGDDHLRPGDRFLSESPTGEINQRNGRWAVDITVPDGGSTFLLLAFAFGAIAIAHSFSSAKAVS